MSLYLYATPLPTIMSVKNSRLLSNSSELPPDDNLSQFQLNYSDHSNNVVDESLIQSGPMMGANVLASNL
jgi:hypothetical protein